jgi:hypothetical protein
LLASLDPFPDFLGEVVEESAAGAPIIVLTVKIVDLLAIGTQRAIGETRAIGSDDLERDRGTALEASFETTRCGVQCTCSIES